MSGLSNPSKHSEPWQRYEEYSRLAGLPTACNGFDASAALASELDRGLSLGESQSS
jgi:hypothetical protein